MKNGFLGLDVGDRSVRYVYLEKKLTKYHLLKSGRLNLNKDTSSEGVISAAIQEIIEKEAILPHKVTVSVTRKDCVIYQVDLPKMVTKELDEAISVEIEKIPDFQNQNFDFIYHRHKISERKDKVIFAAVTKKLLDTIFSETQKSKLTFREFDISPLNLRKLTPIINSGSASEALLVIHEQCSYLIVCDQDQYKLFYKSSMGMKQLSSHSSVADKERTLTTWASELKRVLKYTLLENKKKSIDSILLISDSQENPDLEQYLSKELEITVKIPQFSELERVVNFSDEAKNPANLPALIPLLYSILKIKPIFAFDHFFRSFQLKRHSVRLISVVSILLVLLGGILVFFNIGLANKKSSLKKKATKIEKEIVQQKKISKDLFAQHNDYKDTRDMLMLQAKYVDELNRVSWAEVLSVISNELPEEVSLTSFEFSEKGSAKIKGNTFEVESVAELIRRIEKSKILERGNFDYLREQEKQEKKYFSFSIIARLKRLLDKKK